AVGLRHAGDHRRRQGAPRPDTAAVGRGDPRRARASPLPLRLAAADRPRCSEGGHGVTLPPSLEKHPLLDTWVRIDPAETVTVFSGKSEHGQGLRSTLAPLRAAALDLAPERGRVAA